MLIRNFCVASKVKQEHAPEDSSIYVITPVEESEDAKTWVEKAHVDRFILIVPKTWETMLRMYCSQNYVGNVC